MIYIRGALHDNFPGVSGLGFFRKLLCTKTKQGTDKSSNHNRPTAFSQDLVLLTRASTGVVSTLSINLSYIFITLPHNLRQLPFSPPPPPPPPTEYAAPLVSGGHAKSYNRVTPWPPNKSYTNMMTYLAAADFFLRNNNWCFQWKCYFSSSMRKC